MFINTKMVKSDLSLSTYVQYMEDFCFWMNVAGRAHRLPEREIAKCFVSGLKPDVFREEMFSRIFETERMTSFVKPEKNHLLIGIYWKFLIELKK